jgi:uncharacterized protein with PQ loop repeat
MFYVRRQTLTILLASLVLWFSFQYQTFVYLENLQSTQDSPICRRFAWLSTALFISSRFPQLFVTYRRGSAESLALSMFFISIVANFFNFWSLRVNSPNDSQVWQLNAILSMSLDACVLMQYFYYKNKSNNNDNDNNKKKKN